jgi:hypothetical protein
MAVKSVDSMISEDQSTLVENTQLKFNVREIEGKQFLVHKVLMNDSITMLALKYNVAQHLIRNTNTLLTDNIFSR